MNKKNSLFSWIEQNAIVLVFGVGVAWGGYQAGKSTTEAELAKLTLAVQGMTRRVELLCEDSERCAKRYPPLGE